MFGSMRPKAEALGYLEANTRACETSDLAGASLLNERFVGGDLFEGERLHVGLGLLGAVPADQPVEGGLEVETRGPGEVGAGAGGVEFEVVGFVGSGGFVEDP